MPDKFETALEVYRTKSVLGEGGSGRVYRVRDTKNDEFAIKCLFPELVKGERLRRFKNELSFCLRNTHPNILSVVDHGFISVSDTKTPFYVMRLYPSTLRKAMQSKLASGDAYELFHKILAGIEEAHGRDIWHRDLKPENVLLDPATSDLVVADFGIAHFAEEEIYTLVETSSSDRLANFKYAAPEQRLKGRRVDQRADIFALGLMLNEVFTGEIPQGTEFKTVKEVAAPYSYIDEVVNRMTRQNADRRPSRVREVILELSVGEQSQLRGFSVPSQLQESSPDTGQSQAYTAEVDSAGRLDDVSMATVLTISAGLSHSISIPADEKASMLDFLGEKFPSWSITRRRVYFHTLLLYVLLREQIMKLDNVVIDPEYRGYEPLIKGSLLTMLRESGLPVRRAQISFDSIGRNSPARQMARRVRAGSADPDLILSARQLMDLVH